MNKSCRLLILLPFIAVPCFAQNITRHLDSLKHLVVIAPNDTTRILRLAEICHDYGYVNYDSALRYGQQALKLSEQTNYTRGKVRALFGLGCTHFGNGDMPKSLELQLRGLQLAEENHYDLEQASCLMGIGFCYNFLADYPNAIASFKRARKLVNGVHQTHGLASVRVENEINLGISYMEYNQMDSAVMLLQKVEQEMQTSIWRAVVLQSLGDVHIRLGNYEAASANLHESLVLDLKNDDPYSLIWANLSLAKLFKELRQPDSCLFYARRGLAVAQGLNAKNGILAASLLLTEQYESRDPKEALRYRKLFDDVTDELYGPRKVVALQKTLSAEQERQRKVETERIAYQNQIKQYAFLTGLGILFLVAFILYRNNRREKKAKVQLQEKNELIEQTLTDLKSTQSQLIQSEKMASLGELTAGIAHEIQNPLNFVNNFSEVNTELIEELANEVNKGNLEEAKAIAKDIKDNELKINHHGKRADAIVKGMLQHSRSSSGVKELTDINALADEYLRLAYHGLRAKDKSFNATMKTAFDESVGKFNVIPQDMGRVILNLITNAFYAVAERKKQSGENYDPIVSVSTRKTGNKVLISVKDNGNGIPQVIVDKIFQPFFTTKPTGQGTGLGLSMSYDIVKAHGGELKVETREGEGAEFVIVLPM